MEQEWTGQLALTIKKKDQSVPAEVFYQGALKIMRPQYLDESGQVTYFVLNPGGGYLDGDRYRMTIQLAEKASLYLTTQSATKIYQTPRDFVYQKNHFVLAENSELVQIPDVVIPYEDSIFRQEQHIEMSKTAYLFTSEIVTPGWDSQQRGFTYRELNLLTKIHQEGQLVVMDRLLFQPAQQELAGLGMLEGYKKIASLFIIHPQMNESLTHELLEALQEHFSQVHFGLSQLAIAGLSLRALGDNTQELEALIQFCYDWYCRRLQGREPADLRKY